MAREADLKRKTTETDITIKLDLDGTGKYNIDTGIGFFDHMLELMAKHGFFDLMVKAKGDVNVDYHHTVEDIGIVFGQALSTCLGDYQGVRRYGFAAVPMDEVLAQVTIDLCKRPTMIYNLAVREGMVGTFDIELVKEFFQAVVNAGGITLHINVPYGTNRHHVIEAVFKAWGRALCEAVSLDFRVQGVPSTKGML